MGRWSWWWEDSRICWRVGGGSAGAGGRAAASSFSLTHALPRPLDATLTQLFAKNDPPPSRATITRRHQPYRGCPPPPAKPLFSPYQPTCPLALPALLGLAHVLFARAFDSVPDWVWQITLL